MKKLLAIRHVGFEDLGTLEAVLINNGFETTYIDPDFEVLKRIDPLDADLIVILGGPIGAYDEDKYPFLNTELTFIKRRIMAKKPLLGFCLGAQLIARALGAEVYPGKATEIGWIPLQLTQEGKNSPVIHLNGTLTNMMHWHSDTFDLPTGAIRLASTDHCRNQVFSWEANCLAFQCHPEFDSDRIESWLIGHACELQKHRINVSALRDESKANGTLIKQQSALCIEQWLDQWGGKGNG